MKEARRSKQESTTVARIAIEPVKTKAAIFAIIRARAVKTEAYVASLRRNALGIWLFWF